MIVTAQGAFARAAADWIAGAIVTAVAERGACAIALSGGTTPRIVYAELATRPGAVPWDKLAVYFGDERCVPPDDPASNYCMARAALLSQVPLRQAQVFRMPAERSDTEAAARDYAAVLPDRLDVLLLGIGLDGHTASLFPGAPQLDEYERRVVPAVSPLPPRARLTITPPVIARARRIAVIATGADKASEVQRALEGPVDWHATPVQLARAGTWLLDRDAAALLQP